MTAKYLTGKMPEYRPFTVIGQAKKLAARAKAEMLGNIEQTIVQVKSGKEITGDIGPDGLMDDATLIFRIGPTVYRIRYEVGALTGFQAAVKRLSLHAFATSTSTSTPITEEPPVPAPAPAPVPVIEREDPWRMRSQGVTFTKLRSGYWGLRSRGYPMIEGQPIRVAKKDGSIHEVLVGRVLWTDGRNSLATIARQPKDEADQNEPATITRIPAAKPNTVPCSACQSAPAIVAGRCGACAWNVTA